MDTNTNTIEHTPSMSNASDNTNANANDGRDQYGRDSAERTVELKPRDAELVNQEVIAGRHQTYDDALSYVLDHGLKELIRLRKQREELKEARQLKVKANEFAKTLELNPGAINDPAFVSKFVAAMTALKTKSPTTSK